MTPRIMNSLVIGCGVAQLTTLGSTFGPAPARAGGYDTPILYSARYLGLGGSAIAFVDDPSAMFHNPAGLMGTEGLTLTLNGTLILGSIQSSPTEANPNEESEPLLAFAPLVGASLDVGDTVAFGLAFFPVASAGAEYLYTNGASGTVFRNFTSVKFLELTAGLAVKIPDTGLSLGAAYRVDFVSLARYLGPLKSSSENPTFDVDMSGVNPTGLRFGLQWQPVDELQLGFVFRSLTRTKISDSKGIVVLPGTPKVDTEFTLPAKFGFGIRGNIRPVSVSLDIEYALQSQNKKSTFKTTPDNGFPAVSVFDWKDAVTARFGVEYAYENRWFFRGGFIYDGQVSIEEYPSAFGTPPTSTLTVTAGVGYKHKNIWSMDFAFAQRMGSTKVERGSPSQSCVACSADGDYSLSMTGLYLDFTYAFPNLFK